MLKIKDHRSYYTSPYNEKNTNDNIIPFKIPKIHNSNKMSFTQWYDRFKEDIDNITDLFIKSLFELKFHNLIVHFSVKQLRIDFINKLYKTSYNSFKNYP